ncbi:hypothetical protein D3C71_1841280 [compost metagenome]
MSVGQTHGATGTRLAERRCDSTVGGSPAVGDFCQLGPDLTGELAAGHVQGHAEFSAVTGKIRGQLLFDLLQMPVVPRCHGVAIAIL